KQMDQPTFQWQYFQHGSVRLPPFCRGRLEAIASFPVRPDDVWIASYPKSGTSVLQEMVFLISQGVDPAEVGIMNIAEQMPVLEHPQPGLDILTELTTPRIIKTHLPYGLLPRDLWDSKAKVVYMARNPKDLAVSYYQFLRSLRTPGFRGSFPEFCRRFLENRLAYGSWFDHVQEFWNHRNDEQILFLKYEDLHQNLPKVSEQLQAFLSIKQETAHAQDVVQHCSQLVDASMQPHARGNHTHNTYEDSPIIEHTKVNDSIQRGRVGIWKDSLSVEESEHFDVAYGERLSQIGLQFEYQL
uniref:Sulfotransferase n=1 Tax=Petromyzon marinus TaxID=7757 RepID=S4RGD9_PETMA